MKKLISIMLALVFVFSMATVAFAEEGDGTTYTDASTVTITKVYKLANAGTTSPAETFMVEQVGNGNVTDGDATSAPALGTITGAVYTQGAATTEGATAYITINLPKYDKVGVYEYTLKETAGTTAGVTYWSNDIKLVVTVIQQDGQVRVAAVHTESAGSQKSGSIENTYSAGSLAITKNVTGNLGDTSKYFKVTVTLTGETGKVYADSYSVSATSYTSNPTSIVIGKETDFYLKDSETITISNLPYGVTYTVEEADYQTTDKYDAPSYNFSDEDKKIDSASDTVTITNNKTTNVDTGISLDSVPFILILAVCAGAAILFVTKRRSVEF